MQITEKTVSRIYDADLGSVSMRLTNKRLEVSEKKTTVVYSLDKISSVSYVQKRVPFFLILAVIFLGLGVMGIIRWITLGSPEDSEGLGPIIGMSFLLFFFIVTGVMGLVYFFRGTTFLEIREGGMARKFLITSKSQDINDFISKLGDSIVQASSESV